MPVTLLVHLSAVHSKLPFNPSRQQVFGVPNPSEFNLTKRFSRRLSHSHRRFCRICQQISPNILAWHTTIFHKVQQFMENFWQIQRTHTLMCSVTEFFAHDMELRTSYTDKNVHIDDWDKETRTKKNGSMCSKKWYNNNRLSYSKFSSRCHWISFIVLSFVFAFAQEKKTMDEKATTPNSCHPL